MRQVLLQSRAALLYCKVGQELLQSEQSLLQSGETLLQSGTAITNYGSTPFWDKDKWRHMFTNRTNAVWEWSFLIWRNGQQRAQTFLQKLHHILLWSRSILNQIRKCCKQAVYAFFLTNNPFSTLAPKIV